MVQIQPIETINSIESIFVDFFKTIVTHNEVYVVKFIPTQNFSREICDKIVFKVDVTQKRNIDEPSVVVVVDFVVS